MDLINRGMIPPHLRKAMALRNKMRGGGTTIGALDAHNGPNYSGPQTGMGMGMPSQMGGGSIGGPNRQGIHIYIYVCLYIFTHIWI
jgi:hypothetical protein